MTDAHRKAVKAYADAREARGERKSTFWLTPEQDKALNRLAETSGSRQKAIERLLDAVAKQAGG